MARQRKTPDQEVDELLHFIARELNRITHGDAKTLAGEWGVKEPSLVHYRKYGVGSNPELRTAYKILRGLLRRPPFSPELPQPIITVMGQVPVILPGLRPEKYLAVPLVEGRIAAGPGGEIPADAVNDLVWVYEPEIGRRQNLVAVRLGEKARSMEPSLHPGDIVIIDRDDKTITPRGVYAVRLPEDPEACAIKRLQTISGQEAVLLLSDNTAYEPHMVPWSEHLIIGRVVWSWTSWIKEK